VGGLTCIALLRGINVGGHKIIRMDALRKSCEALGLESVQTYLQSGNVIFKAPQQSPEVLARTLERKILRSFGFPVVVILRSPEEMNRVINHNPFLKAKGTDASRLHVAFLSRAPEKAALNALEAFPAAPEQFQASGKEIYLHYPNGAGKAKLSNNALERVLSVSATTRNWNTVNKLCEMSLA